MDLKPFLSTLKQANEKHTIYTCSSSTTILHEKSKYFFPHNDDQIQPDYLNFIKRTKKEVCQNSHLQKLKQPDGIKYIRFFPSYGSSFEGENFAEVDINSAYWKTAFNLNLISEETYKEGMLAPKPVRLTALGASAISQDVFIWDTNEGRYNFIGTKENPAGRAAFFTVAKTVGEIIDRVASTIPHLTCFYWVDALFVPKIAAHWVMCEFNTYGFEAKTYDVPHIQGYENPGRVVATVIKESHPSHTIFERKIYFKKRKKVLNFDF